MRGYVRSPRTIHLEQLRDSLQEQTRSELIQKIIWFTDYLSDTELDIFLQINSKDCEKQFLFDF